MVVEVIVFYYCIFTMFTCKGFIYLISHFIFLTLHQFAALTARDPRTVLEVLVQPDQNWLRESQGNILAQQSLTGDNHTIKFQTRSLVCNSELLYLSWGWGVVDLGSIMYKFFFLMDRTVFN